LTNRQNPPQRTGNTGTAVTQAQFHPLSIARMFWKHKAQILLGWIVLSTVAVGIVYRMPAVYKAEAVILVDSQKIPDKYVMPTVNTALEDRLQTLKKEVLAYDSLQHIIDKFGLYREQRKSLSQEEILEVMTKDIEVEVEKGWSQNRPGAFKITYQGLDPRVVQEVTHDIATQFVDENIKTRERRATDTSQFLEAQLKEAREDLQIQEKKVSDYKLQHNGELPQQENSLGGTLGRLQMELQGNQDAINRSQQEKLIVENSIGVAESSLSSLTTMAEQYAAGSRAADPAAVRRPLKEADVLQARLDAMLARYGEEYPDVKRLRAEIAEQHEAAPRKEAETAKTAQTDAQPTVAADEGASPATNAPVRVPPEIAEKLVRQRGQLASLRASLALVNRDLELRNAERVKILADIRGYESRLERLPLREQEMTAITRDYEISKEHYKRLLDNKISAEMASQMEQQQQAERFTMLQDARVPEVPFKPIRPLWITVGCVAALLISLVVGGIRELRKGAVLGEWELPRDVAVLGRVPWIALKPDAFDVRSGSGTGSWLQRKWRLALVLSVVVTLACGIAAAVFRGLNF